MLLYLSLLLFLAVDEKEELDSFHVDWKGSL
jgi:hypothetical protein